MFPLSTRVEYCLGALPLLAKIYGRSVRLFQNGYDLLVSDRQKPKGLIPYEKKFFSQTGEDGILEEIFSRLSTGASPFVVEFGIEDGSECCSRNLIQRHNWSGLLIEGSEKYADAAKELYSRHERVIVANRFVTMENILHIMQEYNVPEQLETLVVDIDGNDYWVLQSILTRYKPMVIVCEYNAKWRPPQQWVMPYNSKHQWGGSAYFGASLTSLVILLGAFGYSLVSCNKYGNNAFFVRDNFKGTSFPEAKEALNLYSPPRYTAEFGFPARARPRSNLN